MKYLITQEQVYRLQELADAFELVSIQGLIDELKPIEPLSDKDIMQMWQDAWDSTEKGWIFPIYARAVEAHILGEKE